MTLYEKVFYLHSVMNFADGEFQVYVGLHLIHEASSAPAFEMLRERHLQVYRPSQTFATADHLVPTTKGPMTNETVGQLIEALSQNTQQFAVKYFPPGDRRNGIVHVIGPELGLTQPGMLIVCGDSHTTTHGAFGCIAFGIGTTQVRDVLATQTVVVGRHKIRRVLITGTLKPFVSAKDIILALIRKDGSRGGLGYVYEFAGSVVHSLSMDERMTMCNMAVEAGAAAGYINPDEVTFAYLQGREYSPSGSDWDKAVKWWRSLASDPGAAYDDEVHLDVSELRPIVTWGTMLDQSSTIDGHLPVESTKCAERSKFQEAMAYMGLSPGQSIEGIPIDVAFIGSCTNGRTSDFETVALHLKRSGLMVAPGVRALAVPGSIRVRDELIANGAAQTLLDAGFEFRDPGCSMCIGLNGDNLTGRQACASSSNRNFRGRQGSPIGRTFVMSPIMVAAAAVSGIIADPNRVFSV